MGAPWRVPLPRLGARSFRGQEHRAEGGWLPEWLNRAVSSAVGRSVSLQDPPCIRLTSRLLRYHDRLSPTCDYHPPKDRLPPASREFGARVYAILHARAHPQFRHRTQIECQSQTLISSVALLDLVLVRGGGVPVLLGSPSGILAARFVASCTIRLWKRLPDNADEARTADWLDHAGEILERVTVALLDFAHAPMAEPLRQATTCALRVADVRLASLGLDLPAQLEATNKAVYILTDEIGEVSPVRSRLSF
jgi:hypothetical protein